MLVEQQAPQMTEAYKVIFHSFHISFQLVAVVAVTSNLQMQLMVFRVVQVVAVQEEVEVSVQVAQQQPCQFKVLQVATVRLHQMVQAAVAAVQVK